MRTSKYQLRGFLEFAMFLAAICAQTVVATAANGPDPAKEKELIAVLRSGQPADKALACKKLATQGSRECVPELAKLLADEQLASWARIALEAIPDPAVDEALRTSLPSLQGRLAIGAINSIGVRRDAGAVEQLTRRLKDQQADVASAAAVALGRIGNPAATQALRQSLAAAVQPVRNAVAEGCVLCAERMSADHKASEAAELYDLVRRADVSKPRKLEATRGAILARGAAGAPLLVEQIKSSDKAFWNLGLTVARELPGREAADALTAELSQASPDRAALLLGALADRQDFTVSAGVLAAAKSGDKALRLAAIGVVGRSGDATSLAPLVEISTDADDEIAQAAMSALATLNDDRVNAELLARLERAEGKSLRALIQVVGVRRVSATPALVKTLDHSDAAIRATALAALGETVSARELPVLVHQVVAAKHAEDLPAAKKALRAAAVRMPDRESCAAELAAAIPKTTTANQTALLEILGAMGGPKALETIGQTMKSGSPELQDTGSRVLGEWMNVDAAPVLLDLAKTAKNDKHQVRALRGYIRLARQFAMPDAQRAEMCRNALAASDRAEEQKLVMAVLERYPSAETLRVAASAANNPALKEDAHRVAMAIAQKLGGGADGVKELLTQIGVDPVRVEILNAEYGAGATQRDVAEMLRKQIRDLPLIILPDIYNKAFGGDPVPGTAKTLKIRYRINGKEGEATFAENSTILLPMPK